MKNKREEEGRRKVIKQVKRISITKNTGDKDIYIYIYMLCIKTISVNK